jgi:osmotically-inducible protein OsmY
MYTSQVTRLPVVDAGKHLVGIVSRTDVLTVYDRADADIQREIRDRVIPEECATGQGRLTVTVKGGIVTVEGQPETDGGGHHIAAAIWHVEGVVAVRDQMTYSLAPAGHVGVLRS